MDKILVVDDELAIRKLISTYFKGKDFEVTLAADGEQALQILSETEPDLIVLDIKMPGISGFEVCRVIREYSAVPIIMLTALGRDEDILKGLEAGADDYVTKPFNINVLLARVRSVIRRSKRVDTYNKPDYTCGDLTINFMRHHVAVAEQEVSMTATEYRLLCYLAMNCGRVLTPDQILEEIWGEEYIGESHILQVNIARVRKKLNDSTREPKYIITKSGIGYTMAETD